MNISLENVKNNENLKELKNKLFWLQLKLTKLENIHCIHTWCTLLKEENNVQ